MIPTDGDDLSMVITTRFLKMVGYWMAADRTQQSYRNLTTVYTVIGILAITVISTRELCFSLDNSSDTLYVVCNLVNLAMCLLKVLAILAHRTEFFNLIVFMKRIFLQSKYDLYEQATVDKCRRNCSIYICFFTFFASITNLSYTFNALVASIGQNESDRQLPLPMFYDIETVTPYFEIFFMLQALFLIQVGVCYFCFDNILCIMCLHAACQFRILHYRLRKLNTIKDEEKRNEDCSENCYAAFRSILQYHQSLIVYSDKLEEVFNLFALYQVLIFSLLICLDGYNIVMSDAHITRRLTFLYHIIGCSAQLLMFTYSCDCLMHDSADVGTSVYETPWMRLQMDKHGRMLRKDLMLVVTRSRVPCYVTACGFSPISLETYTKVLSSALSYFTLITSRTGGD